MDVAGTTRSRAASPTGVRRPGGVPRASWTPWRGRAPCSRLRGAGRPPAPLSAAAGAVALTLCDTTRRVWLDAALQAAPRCRPGSASTPARRSPTHRPRRISRSSPSPADMMALDGFRAGTQDIPTARRRCPAGRRPRPAGRRCCSPAPASRRAPTLAPAPLPRHFVEQWMQNNARFPARRRPLPRAPATPSPACRARPASQRGGLTCMSRSRAARPPSPTPTGCSPTAGAATAAVPALTHRADRRAAGARRRPGDGRGLALRPRARRARHQAGARRPDRGDLPGARLPHHAAALRLLASRSTPARC